MTINSPKREPSAKDRSNDVNWGELAAHVARLGYWRLDVATEELIWSDGLFRLYGLEVGEARGLEIVLSTVHDDDRKRMEQHVGRVMESPEARTDQARPRRADGSWRIFSHHTVRRRLPNGAPETVFGVVMDVTERETYRVLAENGSDLIVQSDMDGLITYMSPSVTAMTGFTPQEMLGVQVAGLITAKQDVAIDLAIDAVLANPGQRSACVKLSAAQFKAPLALEDAVATALAETGLPPGRLELELTEAAIMTASRENSEILPRVRRTGVTIAIDEFGAGYSSLHHQRRFPVDRIKIAEIFVRDLETTPEDATIVKATIDFARGLGVTVLAAGVDTSAQFDLLKRWNCAEAQGSAIAGPLEAGHVPAILINGPPPIPRIDRLDLTTGLGNVG